MEGLTEDEDALTIKDVYSDLKHCYHLLTNSADGAYDAMQRFTEGRLVSLWYSDGSGELEVAATKPCYPKNTSLPGTPQTQKRDSWTEQQGHPPRRQDRMSSSWVTV